MVAGIAGQLGSLPLAVILLFSIMMATYSILNMGLDTYLHNRRAAVYMLAMYH